MDSMNALSSASFDGNELRLLQQAEALLNSVDLAPYSSFQDQLLVEVGDAVRLSAVVVCFNLAGNHTIDVS